MPQRKIKFASLFSGVGGVEIALSSLPQFDAVAFAEFDPNASAVLRFHYPNVPNFGDVTKIDWSQFPKVDVLHSSSPCQSFSVAGKRLGMEDDRGGSKLWDSYWKCLEIVKPEVITFENVKGLLSSNKGQDWKDILGKFAEHGYTVKWQLMNALDYGVPQSRQRVIAVGFRDPSLAEKFAFPPTIHRTKKLKDILQPESEVDPKYYLSTKAVTKLLDKMTDEQITRLLSLTAYSQPLKFLDRNQVNLPEYAMTVDTTQTNGVGIIGGLQEHQAWNFDHSPCLPSAMGMGGGHTPVVVNPITMEPQDAARTVRAGGAQTLTDKHNHDTIGVLFDNGVLVAKPETANCIDAHYNQFPDNHSQRTGIAVVVQDRIDGWSVDEKRAVPYQDDDKRSTVPESILNTELNDSVSALSVAHAGSVKVIVPSEIRKRGTLTDISESHSPTLLADTQGGDNEPRVMEIVQAQDGKNYVRISDTHLLAIRRLTPVECCRLMSWPDNHLDYALVTKCPKKKCLGCTTTGLHLVTQSNSSKYKQCGNGIVSKVAEAVYQQINHTLL